MSTSTVALTIEMPSLDASLSWNALESLVVGMLHEACGPRWAPVRGLLAPFACPGCGAPGFIKICAYFPYPIKIWLNGHHWTQRQAAQAGIGVTPLAAGSNSFAGT